MMKNQLFLLPIAFFACLFTAPESTAKDPVFAVPVSVPLFAGGETDNFVVFANFNLVNTLWLRYLRNTQSRYIFFSIANTPRFLNFIDSHRRVHDYSNNEGEKRALIERVFVDVMRNYLVNSLNLKNVYMRKGYDKTGVKLALYPGAKSLLSFNRTLVLSFEDPPYGQSLADRLVTNRNNRWFVDSANFSSKAEPKRVNRYDLMYRYYHNIGHVLGLGHYQSSDDQIDIRLVNNRTEYDGYVSAIQTTRAWLPPNLRINESFFKNYTIAYVNGRATLIPFSADLLRSVMYANPDDNKKAAAAPTALDVYVLRYITNNIFTILNKFVERFLVDELSPLVLQMISTSRYFI